MLVLEPSTASPEASPSPLISASPSQLSLNTAKDNHHPYRLSLVPIIGLAVAAMAIIMLVFVIFLIHRKSRELEDSDTIDKISSKTFSQPTRKFQEGTLLVSFPVIYTLVIRYMKEVLHLWIIYACMNLQVLHIYLGNSAIERRKKPQTISAP